MRRSWIGPVLAALLLTACGGGTGGAGGSPTASPTTSAQPGATPPDAGLVLRVEHVGGFAPVTALASRLPVVSVYADGRVISEGPQIAIHPPPALPNSLQRQVGPDGVAELVRLAQDAGVEPGRDLGAPPLADASSTRFVLVTGAGREELEVYALGEAARGPDGGIGPEVGAGLTEEQVAARADLQDLVDALTDLPRTLGPDAVGPEEPYEPAAVAAVITPWTAPEPADVVQPDLPWPGPALPGEPLALDAGCVVATGEDAAAVLEAAASASAATPWTWEGSRWSVALRPLLPDESGCADLLG